MSEEQSKAVESNENAVNNPSTKAGENNEKDMIPRYRFNDVNEKLKIANKVIEENNAAESARIEAEKVKRGEFDTVLETKNNTITELQQKLEQASAKNAEYDKKREADRIQLIEMLPESKREFGEALPDDKLYKFVEQEKQLLPNIKTDTSRPGVKPSGDFGGFGSIEEWATKDPKGYKQERDRQRGIKIAYSK